MCGIKYNKVPLPTGGYDATATCRHSGKPITISNKYGMFCVDKCDLQENKDAMKQLQSIVGGMFK